MARQTARAALEEASSSLERMRRRVAKLERSCRGCPHASGRSRPIGFHVEVRGERLELAEDDEG